MARTYTETKTVYEFSELSEDAKQKALSKFHDINVDHDWFEYQIEDFKKELNDIGFEEAEIEFSGFWSQGDGLCFDAKINLSKFVLNHNEKRISNLIDNGDLDAFYIAKTSYANHYSHERTRFVDYCAVDYYNINMVLDTLCKSIEALRLDLCKKFYRQLEANYDYLTSEAAIIETIQANEYEFSESGNLA